MHPACVFTPPVNQRRRGNTSEEGGSHNSDDWRKTLTLCQLYAPGGNRFLGSLKGLQIRALFNREGTLVYGKKETTWGFDVYSMNKTGGRRKMFEAIGHMRQDYLAAAQNLHRPFFELKNHYDDEFWHGLYTQSPNF